MRQRFSFAMMLLVVAVVPFFSPGPSIAAVFTPLGDLLGGDFYSTALGVSADGSVIVGQSKSGSGPEAFRWTSGTGIVGLGDLPGGNYDGLSRNVSADGSVIVGQSSQNSLGAYGYETWPEAFSWTAPGPMVGLGDLPGVRYYSQGWDASADGSVIVGMSQSSASGWGFEAFRWTSGGGMVGLGDLPGGNIPGGFGDFFSRARAISEDGSIIVGEAASAASYGQWEAFRWESGVMTGLGDLPGGIFYSMAQEISADGSVIVGFGTSGSGTEAFRRTSADGMVGLGDLDGGIYESTALGASADGSAIVGYGTTASGREAFIWDATNGMRNLAGVLATAGVDLTGWTLDYAHGISSDGRTIVGSGTNPDGYTEAWAASLGAIPEPSSFLVWTVIGVLGIGCGRYRRRKH